MLFPNMRRDEELGDWGIRDLGDGERGGQGDKGRGRQSHTSLFIVHCSLLIAHCSLFIVHCRSSNTPINGPKMAPKTNPPA